VILATNDLGTTPVAMRLTPGLLALVLSACAGNSGAVANALVSTAVAASASAIQRANGGCFANCPVGTTCNESTGYCDPLPCRGECASNELCVGHPGGIERCEPRAAALLKIEKKVGEQKKDATPSDAPVAAPQPTSP
jgi:hypothetical protein